MTSDQIVTNEIGRMSMDLVLKDGVPTEEIVRFAVQECLMALANCVKYSSVRDGEELFPLIFPLEMSLKTEQLRWNFKIVATLKNNRS